jgi:hypothetical protein
MRSSARDGYLAKIDAAANLAILRHRTALIRMVRAARVN